MSSPSSSRKRKLEIARDSERRTKQTGSTRAHRPGIKEDGLYQPTTTAPPFTAGQLPQPRVVGAALGNRPEFNPASPNRPTTTSTRQQALESERQQIESELQQVESERQQIESELQQVESELQQAESGLQLQVELIEQQPQDPAEGLDDMEASARMSVSSMSDAEETIIVDRAIDRFLDFASSVLPWKACITLDGDNYRTWRKVIYRDAAEIKSERVLQQRDPPLDSHYVDNALWAHKNDILHAYMIRSMSLDALDELGHNHVDSASWLWDKLELMYAGSPKKERLTVFAELMSLKIEDCGSYAEYLVRFDLLVARLRKLGYSLPEWMVHDAYIMGLREYSSKYNKDNWEDVRENIQMVIENNKRYGPGLNPAAYLHDTRALG